MSISSYYNDRSDCHCWGIQVRDEKLPNVKHDIAILSCGSRDGVLLQDPIIPLCLIHHTLGHKAMMFDPCSYWIEMPGGLDYRSSPFK